jgi:hypothetical protein
MTVFHIYGAVEIIKNTKFRTLYRMMLISHTFSEVCTGVKLVLIFMVGIEK